MIVRVERGGDYDGINNTLEMRRVKRRVYFDYCCVRMMYDEGRDEFVDTGMFQTLNEDFEKNKKGIGKLEVEEKLEIFGLNQLEIPKKSLGLILVDEILHPFNVFQLFSIILWSTDEYYYYASCIFVITVVSLIDTLYQTRKNYANLENMCQSNVKVKVIRDNVEETVGSEYLVPGDIFVPIEGLIPCDAIIVDGDCLMDESILTGESVPVPKVPVSKETFKNNLKSLERLERHVVYHGTRVLRRRNVRLLVIKSRFSTLKGNLVRSILFPKPHSSKLFSDALYFVGFLAILAGLGFCLAIYNFIRFGNSWRYIMKRALDLFTIAIPPALPATMSVGISYALKRLRSEHIYCISPNKINVSGRLNCIVFDKTGTITEEGLDVQGVQFGYEEMKIISSDYQDKFTEINREMFIAMSTCHSLHNVDGKLVGDPIDVKMFELTGLEISDSPLNELETIIHNKNHSESFSILKIHEFIASLRRTSVIVQRKDSNDLKVYVKGAPESLRGLCVDLKKDLFDSQLKIYTSLGYRVIAVAYKNINQDENYNDRQLIENNLNFLGFIIMANKIKPESFSVLKDLSVAGCKSIISTGDNVLTALAVAEQVKIVPSNSSIVQLEIKNGRLLITDAKNHSIINSVVPSNAELVMTGDAFDYLLASKEDENIKLIEKCRVFARMSPDQKLFLIETLISFGYCVSMVGDGSNDCGALKAADVGISLSDADASIAAPFTCKKAIDIKGVIQIMKDGRAALVTSFGCFKFMALYSMIQFTSVSLSYFFGATLGDFQFLYIDLVLVLPLAITMAYSKPSLHLVRKRPAGRLMAPKIIFSVIFHLFIQALFQSIIFILVKRLPEYVPMPPAPDTKNTPSFENSALFLFANFQYAIYGFLFCSGPPFRLPITSNSIHIHSLK
ncbi:hypothetical protein ROZALSC1DRAFT_27340 [Rozella allomycis CSF55]|uniref:Uncharacterized protein n=1 Tax=Rozella allomycis (strain CSF55) TaxID=988480 RepID=A0A4P9YRB0_ROZAC|nr:hypothetical protein ROZALSC1DRAFT_27340 [Rozella allomycis CSF55]